jgi:hypothetical protein
MHFKPKYKILDLKDFYGECHNAKKEWLYLSNKYLHRVKDQMSSKEYLHQRHTVFRIDMLMYLYARLRRQECNTRLGVLCGILTHLLDYLYDHRPLSTNDFAFLERLREARKDYNPYDSFTQAVAELSSIFWSIVPNPSLVSGTLAGMLETQRDSLQQVEKYVTPGYLELLTKEKGHKSLCLYYSIVNPDFDKEEANHLVTFGHYMQHMDDLEDYYEDRLEHRNSCISNVAEGCDEANRLLKIALPDLAAFYKGEKFDFEFFSNAVMIYHNSLLKTCQRRERLQHFPSGVQKFISRTREFYSFFLPMYYLSPLELIDTVKQPVIHAS